MTLDIQNPRASYSNCRVSPAVLARFDTKVKNFQDVSGNEQSGFAHRKPDDGASCEYITFVTRLPRETQGLEYTDDADCALEFIHIFLRNTISPASVHRMPNGPAW